LSSVFGDLWQPKGRDNTATLLTPPDPDPGRLVALGRVRVSVARLGTRTLTRTPTRTGTQTPTTRIENRCQPPEKESGE
jgi:hypothetical protein